MLANDYFHCLDLFGDPSLHSHQKLPQRSMNRSELQEQLIKQTIEGMDFKTMWSVLYDFMDESYDKYSDEELLEEVKEYYPDLLDG